jgi:hypothetical protein
LKRKWKRISIITKTSDHIFHLYSYSKLDIMSESTKKPTLIESMVMGGTAAAFAVNFTHPIELVKTRMQVSGAGIGPTVSEVMSR